jgi:uncharacterized delta-60 repeat protein
MRAVTVAAFAVGLLLVPTLSSAQHLAGSLDPSFGKRGQAAATIDEGSRGDSVALQPDGKIVVAGTSDSAGPSLARFKPNGKLDPSFGSGGIVSTPLGSSVDFRFEVAVQPDGKILVAGTDWGFSEPEFALLRYNSDGSLDNTFGSGGIATESLGGFWEYGDSIALQSDGKILVGGVWTPGGEAEGGFVILRFTSDGSLDDTFGIGGAVTMPFGGWDTSLAVQPDGKILLSGTALGGFNSNFDFCLVRVNPDGTLDQHFGNNGQARATFTPDGGEYAHALAVLPSGRIMVVGSAFVGGKVGFALARFTPGGALDASFGVGGLQLTAFGGPASANAVVAQPDGKVIVAGSADTPGFIVMRYDKSGELDKTFGVNGQGATAFHKRFGLAESMAAAGNGKVVVGGYAYASTLHGSGTNFAIARYLATQPPR